MTRFTVTYDTVTEASAREGEASDLGYASPGGWKHPDVAFMTLREAVQTCGLYPRTRGPIGGFEDGGRAFYTADSDINYRTGEETRYALHPPTAITPASYRRLRRLLTGR